MRHVKTGVRRSLGGRLGWGTSVIFAPNAGFSAAEPLPAAHSRPRDASSPPGATQRRIEGGLTADIRNAVHRSTPEMEGVPDHPMAGAGRDTDRPIAGAEAPSRHLKGTAETRRGHRPHHRCPTPLTLPKGESECHGRRASLLRHAEPFVKCGAQRLSPPPPVAMAASPAIATAEGPSTTAASPLIASRRLPAPAPRAREWGCIKNVVFARRVGQGLCPCRSTSNVSQVDGKGRTLALRNGQRRQVWEFLIQPYAQDDKRERDAAQRFTRNEQGGT